MAPQPSADPPQVVMVPILSFVSNDPTRLGLNKEQVERIALDLRNRRRQHPDRCPFTDPLLAYVEHLKYHVLAGNHRLAAAFQVGESELPTILVPKPENEAERRAFMFRHNQLHCAPSKLETAMNILDQMSLRGCGQGEAAEVLGVTGPDATKAIAVFKGYPTDLHGLIGEGDGKVPFTCAYLMAVHVTDEAKVREFSDRFVKGLMTRHRLEEEIAKLKGKKPKKEKPVSAREDGAKIELPGSWGWQKLAALGRKLAEVAAKGEKHTLPFSALQQLLKT